MENMSQSVISMSDFYLFTKVAGPINIKNRF